MLAPSKPSVITPWPPRYFIVSGVGAGQPGVSFPNHCRDLVHRLNNLLMVVLANADSALASDDPASMRRALEVIAQASTHMATALHDFSRSPSGTSSPNRK